MNYNAKTYLHPIIFFLLPKPPLHAGVATPSKAPRCAAGGVEDRYTPLQPLRLLHRRRISPPLQDPLHIRRSTALPCPGSLRSSTKHCRLA
jgi:hypothetical protein